MVHPNIREHTSNGLTIKREFLINGSTKQKLNTKNSTETEIVETDSFILFVYWTEYFLKTQEYNIKNNIIFQDNKTDILLEKNGKSLSTKRTKYINIRYFFITDRISKKIFIK